MFSSTTNSKALLGDFRLEERMQRYSNFVPRLYNFCKSLGFESGKIIPSRAFCSDESQGFPIILITKHFGTFPFNHGMVGGVVATDRHGPHAEHGQDGVIIQASHVGYDAEKNSFGSYRRLQTTNNEESTNCGKIAHVLEWYSGEYQFAADNILLQKEGDNYLIIIDNQLLHTHRSEGLFLDLKRMVDPGSINENGGINPIRSLSTSKCFYASKSFRDTLQEFEWQQGVAKPIGENLLPELFRFKREIAADTEGKSHLESNLLQPMSWIVTSPHPLLTAAQINTQVEFDRTYRTLVREKGYQGKKLLYIAGLNIDISPQIGQIFPLTKFVPWAAYIQDANGNHYTLEQDELFEKLKQQTAENPDQIDLEKAITKMREAQEVKVIFS